MSPQSRSQFPEYVRDVETARRVLERDGAVVLAGFGAEPSDAVRAATEVFRTDVVRIPDAAEVRAGGERDRRPANVDHTTPLEAHTDGFAYGDRYPDYFCLGCGTAARDGGESFLVDGDAVMTAISRTRSGGEILARLQSVAIDQTEPGMQPSLSPVIGRTVAGRPMLRRFPFQRPAADSIDPAADQEMIDTWRAAVRDAALHAPRFKLRRGDVVMIDNYRMMHGREAYGDLERVMWRVWIWTTAAFGVPDGLVHSDSRYATEDGVEISSDPNASRPAVA